MNDLASILRTITKISVVLFAVGVVLLGVWPSYRSYTAGMLLGMLVSYVNVAYLGLKTRQMSDLVVQGVRKRFNPGFLTRASLAVLAVMFAYKSDQVELVTTIIGLFYGYAALVVAAAALFFKKSS